MKDFRTISYNLLDDLVYQKCTFEGVIFEHELGFKAFIDKEC